MIIGSFVPWVGYQDVSALSSVTVVGFHAVDIR